MFRIIVKSLHEITMHFSVFKYLFFIAMLCGMKASAQTKIILQSPDGYTVKKASIKAYSPFGVQLPVVYLQDSAFWTVQEELNRLQIVSDDFKTMDTVFKKSVPVGGRVVLVLVPNVVLLDEVIVSTGKNDGKLKESTVSVSIIKPYVIENKISTDIATALDQSSGISIADNQINIRSGSGWSYGAGSRVMVLVDDLPMLSGDANSAQISFIPVENIAQVEVVKSAGSVLYGSSALNGIVNVKTADASDTARLHVTAFTGIFDQPSRKSLAWSASPRFMSGSNGFYSKKIHNTSLTISWNSLKNDGYRMHEFENRSRLSVKVKQQSSRIKGLQYGLNTSVQAGKSGSFLLWESYELGYIPLDSGYSYTKTNRMSIDPFIRLQKGKIEHALMGRLYFLENDIDNGNPTIDQDNGSSLHYGEYKNTVKWWRGKLKTTQGIAGFVAETHSPLYGGKQHAKNAAAYIQAELKLNRTILNAGARYEYYKLNRFTQTKPVFRAGINHAAGRATFLRASVGQGFRFPSMAEAFVATSVGPVSVYPNPELRPETGWTAEIGVKQGFGIQKVKGYMDLAFFRTELQNMMEFTFAQWSTNIFPPTFGAGFKSINTAHSRVDGFEVEIAATGQWNKTQLSVFGGYTYTLPLVLGTGEIVAYDSLGNALSFENTRADSSRYMKYRYKHLFRFDIQAKRGKWEAGLSLRANSAFLNIDKAFQGFPIKIFVPGIEKARREVGSAFVTDLRVAYTFSSKWRVNAQVNNVGNRLYMNRPADLRPPRSFQLQLLYRL